MKDWMRWMHASVALYLRSVAAGISVPAMVEGIDERSSAFSQAPDRIEIRVNGPYTRKVQGGHSARLFVNVLVTSNFGDKLKNAFGMDNILGEIHAALDQPIPLLRVGSVTDDKVQIGCLSGVSEIKVFHFGQLAPEERVRQAIVTAAFQYEFDE